MKPEVAKKLIKQLDDKLAVVVLDKDIQQAQVQFLFNYYREMGGYLTDPNQFWRAFQQGSFPDVQNKIESIITDLRRRWR